ncbi:MAG: enoyl-CoA hydratase/isomerase family protein [Planctomycetota bacterium]|jgi:enoyl-CoA hydratase
MSKTQIKLVKDGGYATIKLFTEGGGLNVMSSAVLKELRRAVVDLAGDDSIRCTVVHGEGKVFAAGADIKEMMDFSPDQARGYGELGQAVLQELADLPSITVAAINGPALGGGLELALACDFRIAVKSAKIGLPETSLGLIPGWSGISRLIALIGPSAAKKLFLNALPISAEDGVPLGLIDEVVNAQEDLDARVPAFCKSFRRAAPQAVALAKRAAATGDDLSAFADCFSTDDAREGIAAFVEKRTARWME